MTMPFIAYRWVRVVGPKILRIKFYRFNLDVTLRRGMPPVSLKFVDAANKFIPLSGEDTAGHAVPLVGPLTVTSSDTAVVDAVTHGVDGIVLRFHGVGSANITVTDTGDDDLSITFAVTNSHGPAKSITLGDAVDFVEEVSPTPDAHA